MPARKAADIGVPATGASWIMMGMPIASERRWKNASMKGSDMRIVAPFNAPAPGGYDSLGGEVNVDLNYVAKNAIANLDVRLFITNVFDNTNPIGMVVNNGVFHPRGRGLGFQLSRRF